MLRQHKQKKVYRLCEEKNKQRIPLFQIFLRTSVVFVFVFLLLSTVMVSAAKLPPKVVVTKLAPGASMNIGMPVLKKDDAKLIEICRGSIKQKCTVLAKNVLGIKKAIKIPASYPAGDAVIKVSFADTKTGTAKKVILSNLKVKITAANLSGAGGGGGGGGSGGDGASASSSATGVSTAPAATPSYSPIPGEIIIRATPTPTPPLYNPNHPVLINH